MGNILIVEDDPNIRKLVRVNLTKRGYLVSEAEDSHQAIALFQAEPIDMVLLDLMLPGLSGHMGSHAPVPRPGRSHKKDAGSDLLSSA